MGKKRNILSIWSISALIPLCITLCYMFSGSLAALKSHYEALGLKETATAEEIVVAYEKLSKFWYEDEGSKNQGFSVEVKNIVEVQWAFEVLSNAHRRRDYDFFGVDELQEAEALMKLNKKEVLEAFPLAKDGNFVPIESRTTILNATNFVSVLESNDTWFIEVYSLASASSRSFADTWEKLAESLDGVAKLGVVELGEIQLVGIIAEKNWATKRPFFRHGLPSILAIPSSCKKPNCLMRYTGKVTYESVEDWCATSILKLPRILYYSPQGLITDIIQTPGPDKVKVIGFSKTGERAAVYVRKAAKDYWQYSVFAFVLWREQDAVFWETRFGVESAPAFVFLKDPGVRPIIYHGAMNGSNFVIAMEAHKNHVLPQLRSITAEELGCDAASYSQGGKQVLVWYCLILVGKPGLELSQKRAVLRSVQEDMLREINSEADDTLSTAAKALKEKRLTLTWLDGEKQKRYCYFLVHSDEVHDTCGPKRYGEADSIPRIFLVRYQREPGGHEDREVLKEKKWKSIWNVVHEAQDKTASVLVASFNGSMESEKIIAWISQTVKDGDAVDLPNFKVETPMLIPEDFIPYKKQAKEFLSDMVQRLYYKSTDWRHGFSEIFRDPKLLHIFLVVSALYFSMYYLGSKRNRRAADSSENSSPSLSSSNPSSESSTLVSASAELSFQDAHVQGEALAGLRMRKESRA